MCTELEGILQWENGAPGQQVNAACLGEGNPEYISAESLTNSDVVCVIHGTGFKWRKCKNSVTQS